MSFTKKEESKLNILFKIQEHLPHESEEYLKNRDRIVNIVLNRLHPKMNACQRTWMKKHQLDDSDCASLMQECLLASVDGYKISRGNCKFTSFFWTVTSQLFKNYLSHLHAQKRMPHTPQEGEAPVFTPVCSYFASKDSESSLTLLDILAEKQQTLDDSLNTKLLLEKIYSEATGKQKQILKRLFLGKRYQEIGQGLNISPSSICNILKQIRKKYETFEKDL